MSELELSDPGPLHFDVTPRETGWRLDLFLTDRLPRFSRTHLRRAITAGVVRVDGEGAKPSYRLLQGQLVTVDAIELPREGPAPEPIPLDVIYEDAHLIAINKPPAMVVHPARGHWSGTLASALAYHFQSLSQAGGPTRPGIVHRLDRDTSGILLVAKSDSVHLSLASQFESREIEKTYIAVVRNVPRFDEDLIDLPIGAHPSHREKMAIRENHPTSKPAVTRYRVVERWTGFALLHVFPKTGRTHQIRVHLAHAGHPVACDRLYANHASITQGQLSGTDSEEVLLNRQALHAWKLSLTHPVTGAQLSLEAPVRADIQRLIDALSEPRTRQ
jgi:23S rRNA pseudouridine1911/1915/1917 synthase